MIASLTVSAKMHFGAPIYVTDRSEDSRVCRNLIDKVKKSNVNARRWAERVAYLLGTVGWTRLRGGAISSLNSYQQNHTKNGIDQRCIQVQVSSQVVIPEDIECLYQTAPISV